MRRNLASPEAYRSTAFFLVPGLPQASTGCSLLRSGSSWGRFFAALTLCTLALGYHGVRSSEERTAWREDAFETVLVSAFFALVPPLLAVGLYFRM